MTAKHSPRSSVTRGPWRVLPSLAVILVLLGSPVSGSQKKKYSYSKTTGGFLIGAEARCLFVVTSMTSGDFFDGLDLYETPTGPEFKKHGVKVEYFPAALTIVVGFALGSHFCFPKRDVNFDEAQARAILQSLRFQLFWKEGTDEKPVDNAEPVRLILGPVKDLRVPHSLPPGYVDGYSWQFLCHVITKNLPLTAHLEMKLYDEHDNLIARHTVIDLSSPLSISPWR